MLLDLQSLRATVAFAIALQTLGCGFSLPFVGMIADRFGAARVLAVGGLLHAGLALIAQATIAANLPFDGGSEEKPMFRNGLLAGSFQRGRIGHCRAPLAGRCLPATGVAAGHRFFRVRAMLIPLAN